MAFSAANLSLVAVGGQQKMYMYYTTDAIATVETAAYFLSAYQRLNVGDIITYVTDTGAKINTAVVTASSASTVTTATTSA